MKKIGLILAQSLVISLLLVSILGSVVLVPLIQQIDTSNQHPEVLPEWTFMVYLDGDNNLDSYGLTDLNEMEYGFHNADASHVKVIVFYDRYESGATTYRIVQDTDMNSIASTVLTTGFPEEPNMGSKNTLKNFITFVFNNFPAQHYALDLWDHGGGIFGIAFDDTDNDHLSFDEIDEAITETCSVAGVRINILSMDACLMAMIETDYEFRDYVDYIVASEETIPGDGFPYDAVIDDLCDNYVSYSGTPENFAKDIVDDYQASYSASDDTTLSAVNVKSPAFDNFLQAFDNFTSLLKWESRDVLAAARAATQNQFAYAFFVDLWDFAEQVRIRTTGQLQTLAIYLKNNISNVVKNSQQHNNPNAHGIAIYFPESEDDYDSGYATVIDFGQETEWDEFLDYYYHGPTWKLTLMNERMLDYYSLDLDNNENGVPSQGETINLEVTVKNTGSVPAYKVNVTLTCTSGYITITSGFNATPKIDPGVSRPINLQFHVGVAAPTGTIIEFNLVINASFYPINYYIIRKVYAIINVSTVRGGMSFETAVAIDQIVENNAGIFYSWLPGLDPTDFGEWFKINMDNTSKYLIAGIIQGPANTDFDIHVYTPTGSLLTSAVYNLYPDYCSTILPMVGDYRLRVVPFNGTGVFKMNVTESDTPGPENGWSFGTAITCPRNITYPLHYTLPSPTKTGDLFFRAWLNKGEGIEVELDGLTGSNFDIYIIDRTFRIVASSTSNSYPESCDTYATYNGYYYIRVVPKSGSGAFDLYVTFKEAFTLSTAMLVIIIIIVAAAIIVGLILFFKMAG